MKFERKPYIVKKSDYEQMDSFDLDFLWSNGYVIIVVDDAGNEITRL